MAFDEGIWEGITHLVRQGELFADERYNSIAESQYPCGIGPRSSGVTHHSGLLVRVDLVVETLGPRVDDIVEQLAPFEEYGRDLVVPG